MEVHTYAIIGTLAGCGSSAWLAKYFITKALSDLESLHKKIQKIDISISSIVTRLELLKKHDRLIQEHTAKIAALEGRYGTPIPAKRLHP